MPSPDLVDLVTLTLYDVTPSDLVDRALTDAATKLPGWQPVKGDEAVVLLEANALVAAETVYALNRLPGQILDVLLRLYDVARSTGVAPTGTVEFSTSTGQPLTIPGGSIVRLTLGSGDTLDFTTDVAAAGPGPTLTVAVTAALPTAGANGIVTGTPVDVISPLPSIDSAVLGSNVAAGADPEDELSWRTRGVQLLARLTSTLVSPAQFTAAALTNPLVFRATTLDNNNNGTTVAGHETVAVLGLNGATLSTSDKTALQISLGAQAQGNLAVHVIDPTITAVPITYNVKAVAGYDAATVNANVAATLDAYLSPNTWAWSGTVRRNKLIQIIEEAAGVDYLVSLTAPAADVTLSGVAPLADLGTITPTVS